MTRYQGLILQSDKFDKRVASRDTSNYKIVKYGQLVYGFPMDEGVIAILHRYPMGAVSPAYHVWQPTREIDLTFIDRLLKTPALLRVYKMLSSNVVERRRNLSKRDFVNIEIPLPPLPEQRAIAHVLSNVREAIEATQRVIAAARELKRSLTKHLFTYGSVPVDGIEKVSLKETEIGDMPMHWQEAKLGDVAAKQKYSFVDGPFGSNLKSVHYRDNGILVIQSRYFTQGGFTVTSPVFVSEAKADELIRSNVKAGDIVIAKIGANYGACTIVPTYVERAVLSGNTMKMTVNEDAADKRYVYYFLDYFKWSGKIRMILATRTAQPALSLSRMRKVHLPLPPKNEQARIANMLNAIDAKIEVEVSRYSSLDSLFNSLLHHLMTGKVRVPN